MISKIQEISNLLTARFPENWWDEYDLNVADELIVNNRKADFRSFTTAVKQDVFDLLNESILIGEYVRYDDFSELLAQINFKLQSLTVFLPPLETTQRFLIKIVHREFVACLAEAINVYNGLFVIYKHRFEIDEKFFIKKAIEKFKIDGRFEPNSYVQLRFLFANIDISKIDLNLTTDDSYFLHLDNYSSQLTDINTLGGNKWSLTLREKCEFLKAKWILRHNHTNKNPVFTIEKSEEVVIDISSVDNKILNHWLSYMNSHYELSVVWKSQIQRDFNVYKNLSYTNCTLLQIHRLTKYYKDVNPSLANLKELHEEIERRYRESKKSSSRSLIYAHAVALNYVINNRFSLLLECNDVENTEVKELYSEIVKIQDQTGIKNFFPQYKYLLYLVKKLEKVYNERKALEFITPARSIINTGEAVIAKYTENIKWSNKYYNYVFQLPYEECLVELEGMNLQKLYLFSSFVLPLSKDKYMPEFREYERKAFTLRASIEVFENIELDMLKFANLKKEIESRDIKSMEIIGIFTAIVTFIAGSLPAFKYIETAYQGMLFMISLATSLSVFVLLVMSVTRGVDRVRKNIYLIAILTALAVLGWIILIYYSQDPHPRKPEVMASTINQTLR